MEKKEEKTVAATKSEKLAALKIAQAMGGFDVLTIANEEKHLSALINRAEKILEWITSRINNPTDPSLYFVRKDIEDIK